MKQITIKQAFMAGYDQGTDDSDMGFSETTKIVTAYEKWIGAATSKCKHVTSSCTKRLVCKCGKVI